MQSDASVCFLNAGAFKFPQADHHNKITNMQISIFSLILVILEQFIGGPCLVKRFPVAPFAYALQAGTNQGSTRILGPSTWHRAEWR